MRDYGRVHTAFWTSRDVVCLSDDAKLLALYLLTCQHSTIAGVYRLPAAYVCDDLGWGSERVSKGFRELIGKGFATLCDASKWVFVRRFLVWNRPDGPNQWKAVTKIAVTLPADCSFRTDFIEVCELLQRGEPLPPWNPSETPSKPLRIQEQEQEQKQEQEQEPRVAAAPPARAPKPRRARGLAPEPAWFVEFKQTYPQRSGDQGWPKALAAGEQRIREGATPEQMLAGARRYAAYIVATDRVGSQYVKQASTFLGPDRPFLQPWNPPPSKADRRLASNVSAAEEFLRRTDAA